MTDRNAVDGGPGIQKRKEVEGIMENKQEVKKEIYVKPEMVKIESVDVITLGSIGLTG